MMSFVVVLKPQMYEIKLRSSRLIIQSDSQKQMDVLVLEVDS